MILPQRWATLQPYLDQALDADGPARAALLLQLQEQDPGLARDLHRLLQGGESPQGQAFLAGAAAAELFNNPLAGQRLGAWRLLRPIGEGGMGSVWLAQRDDGRFDGQAAVKLLNLSLTAGSAAERFRREGHILARLAHAHIARLFDAGVSSSGQPYLVLEHVQGLPIDQHCRQRGLGVPQRLRLFITLLDAVAHAHRHLVVHRDIKPANVLVTDHGELKLLDFGIAKLLTAEEGGGDASATSAPDHAQTPYAHTQRADTLLTPGYAAPEQVQGQGITTATDVYALGMLLYVLLSGQHPLLRPGVGWVEALQAGTHKPLPLLSTQLLPHGLPGLPAARLQKLLRGDLDNIVAQALHHDPQARYASASEFADDLLRHLQQRPVQARAPGLAYRAGLFARRQRVPLAVLGAGLLASAVLGGQAWQQQQAARLNQARASSVDGLLQSLFAGMGPDLAGQRQFSARELLDRASAFLSQGQSLGHGLDADTQRGARQRMAQLYHDIGAYEPAISHRLAEVAAAETSPEPQAHAMALWRLADSQIKGQQLAPAQATLARLDQALAHQLRTNPEMAGRAELLHAELALNRGQVPQAEAGYRQAIEHFENGGVQNTELLAWAAHGHGQAARYNGNMAAARTSLQRALPLMQARGPAATVERLNAQVQLGAVESWAGRPTAAVPLLVQAHAELLPRLGKDHPLTVSAVNELAWAHIRQGEFAQARQRLDELRGGLGPDNAWRTPHAALLEARMQLYSGQAQAAVQPLRALLADTETREGGTTSRTEQVRRTLGEALLRAGQTAAALQVLSTTWERQQQLTAPGHTSVATTQVLLGCALARLGQLGAARTHWRAAQPALAATLGPEHPFTLAAASYLALVTPETEPAQRAALAAALQQQVPWQDGAADLMRWLRSPGQQPPWPQLPVVL